jgi:chromatin remodeling complex protein RSC6
LRNDLVFLQHRFRIVRAAAQVKPGVEHQDAHLSGEVLRPPTPCLCKLKWSRGGLMTSTTEKKLNPALMQPMRPSAELAEIVGIEPLPRTEITKRIWAYIKSHNLQNPSNKREILADEKLERVFGVKSINMFEMTKVINQHLSKS